MSSFKGLFAALSLVPLLAAGPAHAQQSLSPAQIAPDIAITEAISRHTLSAEEKTQIAAIDGDLFRHDPAWTLKALRGEATEIQNVRRMDPMGLAEWRKTHIVSIYFHVGPLFTPQEKRMLVAIYTRANPTVNVDRASGTVVTKRDMGAWQDAARLSAAQTHSQMTWTRSAMLKVSQDPKLPKNVREDAGNMERNSAGRRCTWERWLTAIILT